MPCTASDSSGPQLPRMALHIPQRSFENSHPPPPHAVTTAHSTRKYINVCGPQPSCLSETFMATAFLNFMAEARKVIGTYTQREKKERQTESERERDSEQEIREPSV